MAKAVEFYRAIGQIYDSCIPALRSWCQEREWTVKELEIVREPDVPDGKVAFLWVFSELELTDNAGAKGTARVVVATCGFLDADDEKEMEKAGMMVFSTFYGEESDKQEEFVPFIFSDSQPTKFLKFLTSTKGLTMGSDVFLVTPEGMVT